MSPSEQIEGIAFACGVTAEEMQVHGFAALPLDEMIRIVFGESELQPEKEADAKSPDSLP